MIVGIHQPHYLPWLRYFEKILRSDVFIVLDDIQFEKNGFQNRNKIKTPQGAQMLTVPVRRPTRRPIRDVEIDGSTRWEARHRRALEMSYAKAPYFRSYWPEIGAIYEKRWTHLASLNRAMLELYVRLLQIETPIRFSSEIPAAGTATRRLAELCRSVGGDTYLSGAHAVEAYLEPEIFAEAGIALVFQRWSAPAYTQLHPHAGFVPDLAIVDLLFNEGPRAREILASAGGLARPERPAA